MDDMTNSGRRQGTLQLVAFWALAGVTLLISHDAIWLTQVGPGEGLATALRAAGHGYWGLASLALAMIGFGAALGVGVRLRVLRRRAAEVRADRSLFQPRPYLARVVRAWARFFLVVAIGFVIQENIEHFSSHQHAPGLGALLGPEYPLALPVIAALTGLAAFTAALVRTYERGLVAAILAAIRRPATRASRRLHRPPARVVWRSLSPLATNWAGRAPPRQLLPHS
jgi:hypothetical protein